MIRLYGMDAELELKNRGKRDPEFETTILNWIEKVLELKLQDKANFAVHFQTGVLLLKLINVISPGHFPKIDTRDLHLVHHENVNMYLKACWELGVPSSDLFITSDLTRLKVQLPLTTRTSQPLFRMFIQLSNFARAVQSGKACRLPNFRPSYWCPAQAKAGAG